MQDKDRSGCLSKDEIRTLVKKSKDKLNLVDPPFEIEQDWKAMHKMGEERSFFAKVPGFSVANAERMYQFPPFLCLKP